MPASPAGSTPEETYYIRARSGGEVDARRVGRVVVVVCFTLLLAVVIATTVGAANQNSVQTRLQRNGAPVVVTVTFCEGVSSGIGQALIYYSCRGDYTFDGRHYNEVIGGSRVAHPLGQALEAVVVRNDPALLSTTSAVAKRFSPWTPFVTPIVLAAVTLAFAVALLLWARRRRAASAGPTVAEAALG